MCSEVLQSDPENVNALKDRAEAYIQEEHYEEGKSVCFLSVKKLERLIIDLRITPRAQCGQMGRVGLTALLVRLSSGSRRRRRLRILRFRHTLAG